MDKVSTSPDLEWLKRHMPNFDKFYRQVQEVKAHEAWYRATYKPRETANEPAAL